VRLSIFAQVAVIDPPREFRIRGSGFASAEGGMRLAERVIRVVCGKFFVAG
jgi:hypothetical protein